MITVFCEDQEISERAEKYLNKVCPHMTADVLIDLADEANCSGNTKLVEIEYTNLLDLSHELIHAKQFILGQLSCRILAEGSKISYRKRPWEVEAFNEEYSVYLTYFNDIDGVCQTTGRPVSVWSFELAL